VVEGIGIFVRRNVAVAIICQRHVLMALLSSQNNFLLTSSMDKTVRYICPETLAH
jgi:hypothetical protein